MDYIFVLLGFVLGLAAGIGFVWLFMHSKIKLAASQSGSQVSSTIAMLEERLRSRDQQLGMLEQVKTQQLAELARAKDQQLDDLKKARDQQLDDLKAAAENQLKDLTRIKNEAESNLVSLRINFQEESERRVAAEKGLERLPDLEKQLTEKDQKITQLVASTTNLWTEQASLKKELEKERAATAEKLALIENAKDELSNTFKALSAEVLQTNNQSFLDLARTTLETYQQGAKGDLELRQQAVNSMLEPVRESLGRFDQEIRSLEQARVGAYEGLSAQVQQLVKAQADLKAETNNLVTALRAPHVRGRWGEIQLKRVVEIAGMLDRCDFEEQFALQTEVGRQRPDMIVRLPGNKSVVVDAKAPLSAYLDAMEAPDEESRQARLKQHALQIRQHLIGLSKKSYWEQFSAAPEFVVLFLPGEIFFSAALEQDPSLIESGVDMNVILATPTTLIALLKAVAYGWRQENIAQNAKDLSKLGRDLYKTVATLTGYWGDVGKNLNNATEAYNKAVGSLEGRFLPKARKFKELGAGDESVEIKLLEPIQNTVRTLTAPETRVTQPELFELEAEVVHN